MQFSTNPFSVVFYEKPGCAGNERQKKLLQTNGISFQTKSILDTPWNKENLNSFFINLEIEDIVNKFAPKIKNKQIDIDSISKDEMINMMCDEPILIKRPLLEIGENKICGFDIEKINEYLGSNICEHITIDTCKSSDPCKSV